MNIEETTYMVREWGRAKGIIGLEGKATERTQLAKLMEEVGELQHAIATNDKAEKIDAIGDCAVVLILLADIMGTSFEDCLESAYNVIKSRTGKMVAGQFVKDSNE